MGSRSRGQGSRAARGVLGREGGTCHRLPPQVPALPSTLSQCSLGVSPHLGEGSLAPSPNGCDVPLHFPRRCQVLFEGFPWYPRIPRPGGTDVLSPVKEAAAGSSLDPAACARVFAGHGVSSSAKSCLWVWPFLQSC